MFFSSVLILFITGGMLTAWVYRSILWPIGKLQEATKQIRDGNLDFTLDVEDDDEIGQLCQNFEEMRIRLKESTEEKIQYDKEKQNLTSWFLTCGVVSNITFSCVQLTIVVIARNRIIPEVKAFFIRFHFNFN